MGFNSTWKRRCPLILLIKEGSLSSGSASVLLIEGSEASPLCRERNWIRSLFQLLSDFNSHARAKAGVTLQSADLVDHEALLLILQRSQRRKTNKQPLKGEALIISLG